jgi:hypothetical protein
LKHCTIFAGNQGQARSATTGENMVTDRNHYNIGRWALVESMQADAKDIETIFTNRLLTLGIDPVNIPGLVREICRSMFLQPNINLYQINKRLNFLGWTDIELDYYTFSLVRECHLA